MPTVPLLPSFTSTIFRLSPTLTAVSRPVYLWRQLTPEQQASVLSWRKDNRRPWHAPPHRPNFHHTQFHISAACYEHQPHIGLSPERMDSFSEALLSVFGAHATHTVA